MFTAGIKSCGMVCLGLLRLYHSNGRDGFGFLLMGLAGIGVAIWAVARLGRGEPAKD
jgi:TM2 domain-containing membrane protein YozV